MGRSHARRRRGVQWLGALAALVLAGAGIAVVLNRDWERRREEPEGMRKLALTSLPASTPGAHTDWPQWRGPNRDGVSPETTLRTDWPSGSPRVRWKQVIGRGFSSVAVVGDQLFTMEEERTPAGASGENDTPYCIARPWNSSSRSCRHSRSPVSARRQWKMPVGPTA